MVANLPINILAVESSCDDTSASVIKNGIICSNITATQDVHEQYGGVVPELASRAHESNILPVVDAALKKAEVNVKELSAIAFTKGPGLIGALMVGASFAKGMAMALNLPLIGVHHMKAHIMAHLIDDPKPEFPFICLTVSGGHTQLVLVQSALNYEVLGSTIDDAAGEAYDKTAKMLGLPYPGGPLLDQYAQKGNAKAFKFANPKVGPYDFSFSGFKTSVLYFIERQQQTNPSFIQDHLCDLCASIQHGINSILLQKLKKCALDHNIKQVAIAGGVSANSGLRKGLQQLCNDEGWQGFIPAFQYCTDNAAMIAMMAHHQFLAKDFEPIDTVPTARWPIH